MTIKHNLRTVTVLDVQVPENIVGLFEQEANYMQPDGYPFPRLKDGFELDSQAVADYIADADEQRKEKGEEGQEVASFLREVENLHEGTVVDTYFFTT